MRPPKPDVPVPCAPRLLEVAGHVDDDVYGAVAAVKGGEILRVRGETDDRAVGQSRLRPREIDRGNHRLRLTGWPERDVAARVRSEEHTSELQSLRHLVCRLLLEKKKKTKKYNTRYQTGNAEGGDWPSI